MANRLLTPKQFMYGALRVWVRYCKAARINPRDVKVQRALAYDIQTSNGFPYSEEERNRYIETGKTNGQ